MRRAGRRGEVSQQRLASSVREVQNRARREPSLEAAQERQGEPYNRHQRPILNDHAPAASARSRQKLRCAHGPLAAGCDPRRDGGRSGRTIGGAGGDNNEPLRAWAALVRTRPGPRGLALRRSRVGRERRHRSSSYVKRHDDDGLRSRDPMRVVGAVPQWMPRRSIVAGFVAAGVFSAMPGPAVHAIPVTFQFAGVVTQDPLLDPNDPFAGSIAAGTSFSGSYTFESTTPDADPTPNAGSYTSSPGTLSVTIGGNPFSAVDLLNIGVIDNSAGGDFYTVFARNTTGPGTFALSLSLQDIDGTALGSAALPTTAPAFGAFEVTDAFLDGLFSSNQVQIQGRLTSLVCVNGCAPGGGTPVPEPPTVTLLGTGLLTF